MREILRVNLKKGHTYKELPLYLLLHVCSSLSLLLSEISANFVDLRNCKSFIIITVIVIIYIFVCLCLGC